jgi:4a-hydroxytetrahydrobiopterin dehydratase
MARIFFFTAVSDPNDCRERTARNFAGSELSSVLDFAEAGNRSGESNRQILAGCGRATHNGGCRSTGKGRNLMRAEKLSDADIQKNLHTVKGWSLANGKLHKAFECKDFVTAFGKMTQVALVAEWMNHHPEWFNVWNKVVIDLNTHSVQGISNLDFQLAEKINEIFGS